MSRAAEAAVEATQLKGGTLALFKAIAVRIPEGETTTPPMTLDDLTAGMPHVDRTVRTSRDFLQTHGFIKVHHGGRGKVARYEVLNILGARPLTQVTLPLRADLRETSPPQAKEQRKTSAVSADVPDLRAYDIGRNCRRWGWIRAYDIGSFCRRWLFRAKEQRKTSAVSADVRSAASIDRARDVHTVQNVHTHTTAAAIEHGRPPLTATPCRYTGTVHAWCGGRVHVPMALHREFLRKHKRGPAETDTDIDAILRAFYQQRSRAITAAEQLPSNDFAFWRPAYAAAFLASPPAAPTSSTTDPKAENIWDQVRDRIARQINRHAFYDWFRPTALVHDGGDVIQVTGTGEHGDRITDWIQKHYRDVVHEALQEVRPGARVEFGPRRSHEKTG